MLTKISINSDKTLLKTLFIGQNLVELPSVESTNDYALELCKNHLPSEGTIVWAQEQTAGKGQRGNSWLSEPYQNLTFSVILHPRLMVAKQFLLVKVVSLAVAECITEITGLYHLQSLIKIKWPNDIYFAGKKIAGILIENLIKGDLIESSILGIGLNVNQIEFAELKSATSIKRMTGQPLDLKECLSEVCRQIEFRYLELGSGQLHFLDTDYKRLLYGLNQELKFEREGKVFEAVLKDVNDQGKLILEQKSGEVSAYNFKEIKFI